MNKTAVFYEKYTGGHREYIQKTIAEFLKPEGYDFFFFNNPEGGNFLADVIRLAKTRPIHHCHLLTLKDDIFDFLDRKVLKEFLKLNISISATLYNFQLLQPLKFFGHLKSPRNLLKHLTLHKLLSQGIIKRILMPEERISNPLFYPFHREKLVYLPDVFALTVKPVDRGEACRKFNLDEDAVNFLVFGTFHDYKGYDLIFKATNEKPLLNSEKKINIIAAGKRFNPEGEESRSRNSKIKIINLEGFIDDETANLLFSASDCVLMPFLKRFEVSSGTYSLAAGYGNFVITADHGLLAWRVKHFNNGAVFKGENPRSLSGAMKKFADGNWRRGMPLGRSEEYARRCAPEVFTETINKFLADCLKQKKRRDY